MDLGLALLSGPAQLYRQLVSLLSSFYSFPPLLLEGPSVRLALSDTLITKCPAADFLGLSMVSFAFLEYQRALSVLLPWQVLSQPSWWT